MAVIRRTGGKEDRLTIQCNGKTAVIEVVQDRRKRLFFLYDPHGIVRHERVKGLQEKPTVR